MGCIQLGTTFLAENWIQFTAKRNGFKTKATGFCKRTTSVVVTKFSIESFRARESNYRQALHWMNSIKFNQIQSSSLCQTLDVSPLNEGVNASAVILLIEK